MKVEMLVSRAGPNGVDNRGDVIEVPNDEGARMIAADQAIPVRAAAKPERAVPKQKFEKASR